MAVHAPEIDPSLTWLNTTRKLSMRELRGHVVVLDFWTYCCVNCMHVAPVLRHVEETFAGEPLVVVGVHSAKFDAEKDTARIEDAIRRYDVKHPVVVDQDMRTWSAFAVRSWPTLIVVRPDGTIAAVAPGEPDADVLVRFLRDELDAARARGHLTPTPIRLGSLDRGPEGPLAYPGKVAVSAEGLVAVADSGHHRVLVTDARGRVLHVVGGAGQLDDPQGIAWADASTLYIADARAHVVARADLERGGVEIIAGTGELGAAPLGEGAHDARATALRSPWDLELDDGTLYVALAGSHQIAAIDLRAGTITRVAGTGAESMIDGDFADATFSQPSGLALFERTLYVADSETSAVRALDLEARAVRTVVGVGLFDFGDVDGPREIARLQHDVGIAIDPRGTLVVADTYNGKLREVDRATGFVRTIASGFAEPAGVAWDPILKGWLVADTNAHRVVRLDHGALSITAAPPVSVARRSSLPPPDRGGPAHASWFTTTLRPADGQALGPGAAEIAFPLPSPRGKKLASGSPVMLSIEVSRRSDLLVPRATELRITAQPRVTLEADVTPFDAALLDAEMIVRVDAIVCSEEDGEGAVCEPYRAWLRLPVRLAREGGAHVELVAEGA